MKTIIMGIKIGNREEEAQKVQGLLTEYGCAIKTRLGVHEAGNMCSNSGIIILEFASGKEADVEALYGKLSALEGVIVDKMAL